MVATATTTSLGCSLGAGLVNGSTYYIAVRARTDLG